MMHRYALALRSWGIGASEPLFQIPVIKSKPATFRYISRSHTPRPFRFLSSVLALFFVLALAPFGVSSASATTCTSSAYTNPWVQTSSTTTQDMNFSEWAGVNSIPTSCLNFARAVFTSVLVAHHAKETAVSTNAFATKLTACMKGQSASIWSPSSYLNWTRCTLTVSFIPSTTVLGQDFDVVKSAINSHVPLAYVSVVTSFLYNVSNNFGSASCSASSLDFSFAQPSQLKQPPIDIALPCNPPAAIHALRYLMVLGVWAMVIWFIYAQVMKFLSDVTS